MHANIMLPIFPGLGQGFWLCLIVKLDVPHHAVNATSWKGLGVQDYPVLKRYPMRDDAESVSLCVLKTLSPKARIDQRVPSKFTRSMASTRALALTTLTLSWRIS